VISAQVFSSNHPEFVFNLLTNIHFLEAFRLTLIGENRQNEGKQLSVWIFIVKASEILCS